MSRRAVAKVTSWAAGAFFALALVLLQVPPDQVKSNVSAWLEAISVRTWGVSLTQINSHWATAVLSIGLAVSVLAIGVLSERWKALWFRARNYALARFDPPSASFDRPPTSTELQPDYTMNELYRNQWADGSEMVGLTRKIEDHARLGKLAVWGRKYSVGNTNPNPSRPIPAEHWDLFTIDVSRCFGSEDAAACCTEPRSVDFSTGATYDNSYQDLRVSRQQADGLELGEKIYTARTVAELLQPIKEMTSIEIQKYKKPHVGKWIRAQGTIWDMHDRDDSLFAYVGHMKFGPLTHFKFRKDKWASRLETMRRGDRLSAEGRIVDLNGDGLFLDDCVIVNEREGDDLL